MSSQDSDTEFLISAVNQMDHEEEEEDHFLAAVPYNSPPSPYVPPPPAVPHLKPDDPCSSSLLLTQIRCLLQIMTPLHPHK